MSSCDFSLGFKFVHCQPVLQHARAQGRRTSTLAVPAGDTKGFSVLSASEIGCRFLLVWFHIFSSTRFTNIAGGWKSSFLLASLEQLMVILCVTLWHYWHREIALGAVLCLIWFCTFINKLSLRTGRHGPKNSAKRDTNSCSRYASSQQQLSMGDFVLGCVWQNNSIYEMTMLSNIMGRRVHHHIEWLDVHFI